MAFGRLNTTLSHIIDFLQGDIEKQYGVSLRFSDKILSGNGIFSYIKNYGNSGKSLSEIFVGIGDIDFDSAYDGFELFRVAYHEARHIEQLQTNYACCGSEFVKYFRYNDIACDGSPYFYGMKLGYTPFPHYYNNIRERDAELHGLLGAFDALSSSSSFIGDPEQFVLDYLYDRQRTEKYIFGRVIKHGYYIQSDHRFESFDDVVRTCQRQIADSFHGDCVPYFPPDFMKGPVDFLMESMPDTFCDAHRELLSATDQFEQSLMIGSLLCAAYPEKNRHPFR